MSSDIEDLRKELDIVDVISDYIPLQRAGSNFKANCPFHADKTPSFYVSPSKQIFKCFGCGAGGDAIKFVSMYENLSYRESAIQLARRYGIRLRLKETRSLDEDLLRSLEEVSEFYHSRIKESEKALSYIKERGLDSHSIRRFKLGYSPSSGELVRFLKDRKLLEIYEKSGNISKIDEDKYRDLFQKRLIFPIRDIKGRVVGFGGRIIEGEGPKYINSPDSDTFRKKELLFGLYEGLSYLRDLGSVVIVEGYFDVISLHQEGIRNAVAPLGTAFGKDHAKLLSRLVKRAYLLYDSDSAGHRAMRSSIPFLLKEGIEVYPVFLPQGLDPHDFVIREGGKALKELINGARELFEDLLQKLSTGKDTENTLKDLTYFLSSMKDEIKAYTILTEASKITKVPYEVLASKTQSVKDREETRERISFTEKVFLKGMLELKPEVNLEELNLSPRAREIAEMILREEVFEVPEEILSLKTPFLERDFESALTALKIDLEPDDREPASLREVVIERIKSHRGGLRNVRRWKLKVEK